MNRWNNKDMIYWAIGFIAIIGALVYVERFIRQRVSPMIDYPWAAEATIQATPLPGRHVSGVIPHRGSLAALIRAVMENLSESDRALVTIEYGSGNPALDPKAIEAAYRSPTFPKAAVKR